MDVIRGTTTSYNTDKNEPFEKKIVLKVSEKEIRSSKICTFAKILKQIWKNSH